MKQLKIICKILTSFWQIFVTNPQKIIFLQRAMTLSLFLSSKEEIDAITSALKKNKLTVYDSMLLKIFKLTQNGIS